jgi:DNA invertase Pin-like site-specific DNA recombinase
LDAAIRSLKRGDVLLVYKWDRIARDLMLALQYERQIGQKGARVVAVTGDVPGNDPHAEFTRHLLMAVAELERKMISERTRNAMRTLQSGGRRMTSIAKLPYGWKADPLNPKRMVPDERERSIISQIVRMRNGGQTYTQIARRLNALSETAARAGNWSPKVVRSIYLRETQSSSASGV